jgi:hypothetical protein
VPRPASAKASAVRRYRGFVVGLRFAVALTRFFAVDFFAVVDLLARLLAFDFLTAAGAIAALAVTLDECFGRWRTVFFCAASAVELNVMAARIAISSSFIVFRIIHASREVR